jgi:outer membrane protein TolC
VVQQQLHCQVSVTPAVPKENFCPISYNTAATLLPPKAEISQDSNRSTGQPVALTAEAVVQAVLARNPTLSQMVAAWQAASARYPQVSSLEDPTLDLVLAPASIGSNNVDFGGRIGVSQKFPLGGKLGLKGQVALAEAGAAANDVEDARLQLIENATNAFYEYYLVYRAQAVSDDSLRLLKDAQKDVESRLATTKASQQELLQLNVEIGKQNERALTLERMRQVAVARLNTLMHMPVENTLPPPPANIPLRGVLPSVQELRAWALETRPDVRKLSNLIAADQGSLTLAHREFCPELMVGAAYDSIMGNGPSRDLAPRVSVGMNIPLRCTKRNAAVLEAEARLQQHQTELARLTDQVNFQIEEAYAEVTEAQKIVALYEQTILTAAQDNVKAARNAYVATQVPLVSYLEAQRSLVSLRERYFQAIAEYGQRRATLARVVGSPIDSPVADSHRSDSKDRSFFSICSATSQ